MYAKTQDFETAQQNLAKFAKIISHPVRIAIIQLLAEKKVCISGDISKEFPQFNRVTISQHLQELKAFGLIKGEIEGVKICYCLNESLLAEYQQLMNDFFTQVIQNIDCGDCC
jgi:DNA-binding transcriptional ArsR family regulator